ncbi:MAG: hypothetical protein IKT83_00200 [Bacteroidaceae bacterium]|nr:hypothetical protein [Bacteroidaceae bacterium]
MRKTDACTCKPTYSPSETNLFDRDFFFRAHTKVEQYYKHRINALQFCTFECKKKDSSGKVATIGFFSYLCSRNYNVDRFGLLATTEKNAKKTKKLLLCAAFYPKSSHHLLFILKNN